jgi:hypothetical protein
MTKSPKEHSKIAGDPLQSIDEHLLQSIHYRAFISITIFTGNALRPAPPKAAFLFEKASYSKL